MVVDDRMDSGKCLEPSHPPETEHRVFSSPAITWIERGLGRVVLRWWIYLLSLYDDQRDVV